jgi:hypothetical protein
MLPIFVKWFEGETRHQVRSFIPFCAYEGMKGDLEGLWFLTFLILSSVSLMFVKSASSLPITVPYQNAASDSLAE